ncbi:MAG: hypothetical protein QXE46_03735 [Candidatus Thermoplasmatota archaeon]
MNAITAHAMFENGDERYKEIMYEVIKMAKELKKKERFYYYMDGVHKIIVEVMLEIGKLDDVLNFIDEMEEKELIYSYLIDFLIDKNRLDAMKVAEFFNDKIEKEKILKFKNSFWQEL